MSLKIAEVNHSELNVFVKLNVLWHLRRWKNPNREL